MTIQSDNWSLLNTSLGLVDGVVIGVVNVTPDSFSDGGSYLDPDAAVARGLKLVADGAAVIDVGGESTRPGAIPIPVDVELERVLPVVRRLVAEGVVVSVDTYKPEVAKVCLQAGAQAINDITGFTSPAMVELAAASGCGVIVMHMQGMPETMSVNPEFGDVVAEVEQFLVSSASRLQAAGVVRSKIAIDPGFGFGKRAHHSLALLAATRRLADSTYPLVFGTSRKGFLTADSQDLQSDTDLLTAVTTALGYVWGARIFRVHEVGPSRQALQLARAIATQRSHHGDQ